MVNKVKIFQGNDPEKLSEEVNIFCLELHENEKEVTKITPMSNGGFFAVPIMGGGVITSITPGVQAVEGKLAPIILYSIVVEWKE